MWWHVLDCIRHLPSVPITSGSYQAEATSSSMLVLEAYLAPEAALYNFLSDWFVARIHSLEFKKMLSCLQSL